MNNEVKNLKIVNISSLNKFVIPDPKKFFYLLHTFDNGDYLFCSILTSKNSKIKYEIRPYEYKFKNHQISKPKLEFELDIPNNYSLVNNLYFAKFDEEIQVHEFINNNTEIQLKQTIVIDSIKPSICFNGYFLKIINQPNKNIKDILIQPNRNLKNYFRVYRSKNGGNFFYYKKLFINEGDEPGYIFVDIPKNKLLSFINKATLEEKNNKITKSYILMYDLDSYKKINNIYINDLKKFNITDAYREELRLYKNVFLYIHNTKIKLFSMEEIYKNYFQIVNEYNILNYQCSFVNNLDDTLLIAQSKDFYKGDKTSIKQYKLNDELLELEEIGGIDIKNGFVKDIMDYVEGFIVKITTMNNKDKYILYYK